jgi:ribosomal protein L11 methyltransferase
VTAAAEDQPPEWLELRVEADHEAVEPIVELFSQYGYNHGVAIEEPFTQDPDGDNLAVDLSKPVIVRTFVLADSYTTEVAEGIEKALWALGQMREIGTLEIVGHRAVDWEEAWKKHFEPVQVTRGLLIAPPWHDTPDRPDCLVITLDPGMAFGTGTHPTTRLCLEALEAMDLTGKEVLDAGTGTGILAIAGARLGASRVDAVDIDAIAVEQAARNVESNGVGERIAVWHDSLDQPLGSRRYDVVIANIISRILIEIRPALIEALRPDGLLLLSGIIDAREDLVIDAYSTSGLERVDRKSMGDWISHIWRWPASSA